MPSSQCAPPQVRRARGIDCLLSVLCTCCGLSEIGAQQYSNGAYLLIVLRDLPTWRACGHMWSAVGVSWATREHLAVALALGVPAFVVLTKADLLERDEAALDSLVADVRFADAPASAPSACSEGTRVRKGQLI